MLKNILTIEQLQELEIKVHLQMKKMPLLHQTNNKLIMAKVCEITQCQDYEWTALSLMWLALLFEDYAKTNPGDPFEQLAKKYKR